MFDVNLNTHGLKDDDAEEVVDPFYIYQIECIPIPKIDYDRREEDDLLSHSMKMLIRTKNWLK